MKRSLSSMNAPSDWSFFTASIPSAQTHWSPDNHRAFAHQLQKFYYGIEFYIEEMHSKKSVMRRDKYRLRTKEDDKFYLKWLFHGYKRRCSWSCFPSSFHTEMEVRAQGQPRTASELTFVQPHRG